MKLHAFLETFYNVLIQTNNHEIDNIESSVSNIVKYLKDSQIVLINKGINQELVNNCLYALSALYDRTTLLLISKDKLNILVEKIIINSVEAQIFQTAESGKRLNKDLEKTLHSGDNEDTLALLHIYAQLIRLKVFDCSNLKNDLWQKVYPVKVRPGDPFLCKAKIHPGEEIRKAIYTKWLLLSLCSGYIIASSAAWYLGTHELRTRTRELKAVS